MSYDEYVDTEVEYIGTIPKSWQVIRNKHIFNKTKVIVGPNWDKYNVLSLTKNGVIIKDIERNEGKMPSDFSIYQIVNPGNLLMCLFDIDVTPRCVGYIENKGIVSAAYTELSATDNIHMKYYYWWYLMLDIDKQLLHLSKNLRNSLSTEDFMALPVVKPPIEEQHQMANYLDKQTAKIDVTIAKNEELIHLLEEKRVALINQVVTKGFNPDAQMKDSGVEWIGEIPKDWEVDKLKKYFYIHNGSTPKDNEDNWTGDICWVTPADYKTTDIYINQSSRQITKTGLNSCGTTLVPKGSLIVSNRAPIGTVAIANVDLCTNQGCKSLAIKRKINTKFVYYLLSINEKELNKLGRGTTFMELSSYDLGTFKIPIAPYSEQKDIVNYLDKETSKINQTISKIKENIGLLKEYKTSLIHHVVTGKIDVREEVI